MTDINSPVDLSLVQQMAAQVIMFFEDSEPECPECGAGVNRPKCVYEYSHNDCPRHDLATKFNDAIRKAEKLSGLKDIPLWRQRAPLKQIIGDPTEEDLKTLRFIRDNGGSFKSPKYNKMFDSHVLKRCGNWMYSGGTWVWSMNNRAHDYVNGYA